MLLLATLAFYLYGDIPIASTDMFVISNKYTSVQPGRGRLPLQITIEIKVHLE